MERLQGEVLEDLLAFGSEETADFLHTCLLQEQSLILQLAAVVGVVTHQEFSKVDAGVETAFDVIVDGVCEKG